MTASRERGMTPEEDPRLAELEDRVRTLEIQLRDLLWTRDHPGQVPP